MDEVERRRARHELFFRSLNERIEQVGEEAFPSSEERGRRPYEFICECHDTDARQFVIAPAGRHADLAVEEIVDRAARYWIVRKLGEAGELAEADDDRTDARGGAP
jgi:hypothetical protein